MEEKLAQILSDKSLPQNSEKNFISWSNLCDENFVSQVLPNKAQLPCQIFLFLSIYHIYTTFYFLLFPHNWVLPLILMFEVWSDLWS